MFSVIFDMDGTLLDTQKIFIPAWEWAGENQGIKDLGKDLPNVCGMNINGWSAYLEEHYPTLDVDRFNKEMRAYVEEKLVVRFRRGGRELLTYLKQRGIKVGLASGSSRKSVDHHLKEVGISDYFDATVAGNEVTKGKPFPDVFLLTAEKMGVLPQDCYVFEDSVNGVKAAVAAGMKCIGFPDIAEFPEDIRKLLVAEIDSLDGAIEIFEKL